MSNLITYNELQALKELPKHEPGQPITISLDKLPDYLAVNGLVPNGMTAAGVLLVKKEI